MAALQKYSAQINSSPELNSVMAFGKSKIQYRNNSLASHIPQRYLRLANANLKKIRKEKRAEYTELLKQHVTNDAVFLTYDDSELCNLAKITAENYARFMAKVTDWKQAYEDYNLRLINSGFGALPVPSRSQSYGSICKRLGSQKFWRRMLRTAQSRTIESEHVRLGHIGRPSKQLYISNESLQRIEQKRIRNTALLESLESINDDGYTATLKDLSAVSTSNPELRRNELMARLKGMEDYASSIKLVGEFYTLTCPSKYHRYSTIRRKNNSNNASYLNPNFINHNPRDAQTYLNKQWQKIRAELKRRNLPLMGMRVAEPHHDGCPHWHMLFFIKKQHRTEIRQVFRQYALEVDGNEKGAQKHRFTAIKINKKSKTGKRQSAVGYIAKYISKNLSITRSDKHKAQGKENISADFLNDGVPASESISRVTAWASLWGIRQFQQIGGERITVWRELRRLRNNDNESDDKHDIPDAFLLAHQAADKGDYNAFLQACLQNKKIEIVRKFEQLPDYSKLDNSQQNKRNYHNAFDEFRQAPIIGLRLLNTFIQTRLYEWNLQKRRVSALGLVSLTVPSH